MDFETRRTLSAVLRAEEWMEVAGIYRKRWRMEKGRVKKLEAEIAAMRSELELVCKEVRALSVALLGTSWTNRSS